MFNNFFLVRVYQFLNIFRLNQLFEKVKELTRVDLSLLQKRIIVIPNFLHLTTLP